MINKAPLVLKKGLAWLSVGWKLDRSLRHGLNQDTKQIVSMEITQVKVMPSWQSMDIDTYSSEEISCRVYAKRSALTFNVEIG